ncbi:MULTISPECIES: alpha/beta hydrolase [unclassified Leeuwenhoekiella]|uniref:alpha/beta hydrolase n=1 Tax=unclassified Leeuwenhoekiella TaxID=2615029 RepID=UPI000C4471A4|nr:MULTISPECIES: alpha/beta hydrolase [unclassified Leeuwenhoekiella]MAW95427.1 lipase [Leeuwenhoekiella sp.]MBA80814.1 lipase [Leeuwenhoekiella sp.]|tara:strand:- start:15818 stop:16642 length:825 start_codon:yes stop_codon:yes gene_type:complete
MKEIKRCIVICLLFIGVTASSQQKEYKLVKDIAYYSDDIPGKTDYRDSQSRLDIYYPDTNEKVPVIIWFHGGGLTAGSKEIPEALKNQGFCIVGVGYRLSPKVKAATTIEDATAAVAWVFKNIDKYNGDADSIFVSGHSAGGYLALMSVMDESRLDAFDIDANDVAGLVPFSGHTITHFTIRAERDIPGEQPIIDEYAPLYFVRNDAPPILLITGDRELEMLGRYEENAYFYRMMKVAGQKEITQYEMQGYGHNMTHPAFPLLLDFVRQNINAE